MKILGNDKLCEGLQKWIIEIIKDNCRIKNVSKMEPIVFGSNVDRFKKEQMGFEKIRVEPLQLPLKYYINDKSKMKSIENQIES